MNRNKSNRKRRNDDKKQKKIIRCKTLNRPVFDNDVCSQYSSKSSYNGEKSCNNCKHSF